ncbi:hypothetical protein DFH08DRAFT_673676, partial [Mycena albidolilacea]
FSSESCIKGHRSSSCHHSDRPLFEVPRKGRPVSQCAKCRELRKSRRMHSKCECTQEERLARGTLLPSSTKSRRYLPIAPALPNGLRDAQPVASLSPVASDSRQQVNSILNPCDCRRVWRCRCRTGYSAPFSRTAAQSRPEEGLATLAEAAAQCCSSKASNSQTSRPSTSIHALHEEQHPPHLELPAILLNETYLTLSIPSFPTMPPISTIMSLAGSGCTCGLECACPGCTEHPGPEYIAKDRRSCADGCGTCVDAHAGIAMPGYRTPIALATGTTTTSIFDRFLARAAALPAPP